MWNFFKWDKAQELLNSWEQQLNFRYNLLYIVFFLLKVKRKLIAFPPHLSNLRQS